MILVTIFNYDNANAWLAYFSQYSLGVASSAAAITAGCTTLCRRCKLVNEPPARNKTYGGNNKQPAIRHGAVPRRYPFRPRRIIWRITQLISPVIIDAIPENGPVETRRHARRQEDRRRERSHRHRADPRRRLRQRRWRRSRSVRNRKACVSHRTVVRPGCRRESAQQVSIIDLTTHRLVKQVKVGKRPRSMPSHQHGESLRARRVRRHDHRFSMRSKLHGNRRHPARGPGCPTDGCDRLARRSFSSISARVARAIVVHVDTRIDKVLRSVTVRRRVRGDSP